jgi:threonine synthase
MEPYHMHYVSTRGEAPSLGFRGVLMAGLASDGGLYVPLSWPALSPGEIAGFKGRRYADVAFEIVRRFVGGEIADDKLHAMCVEAYATFDNPDVAPLRRLRSGLHVLELFHGPTLAFKDVAMQLLSRLMDHVLAESGHRTTIVGATSGDTGAAAIEAFRDRGNVDVSILFPEGRVSPFQQRQMTTTGAANVHPVAIKGTFDDCQAIVKQLFGDGRLRADLSLSGVNSINWARIVGQIVYYFTAAVELGAPDRSVSFTVPTGNFGDIFAGYAAKRMGLPIERLVIATNVNDILARALATGRYDVQGVTPTTSPSMDIQVSSNFERLLWEASGRDSIAVRAMMRELKSRGAFTIPEPALSAIRHDFQAGRADEATVTATIGQIDRETGFLPDPHTAVGLAVAARLAQPQVPMIALATAHPAKFASAVKAAIGTEPQLPQQFSGILTKAESYATLTNDVKAVEGFIRAKTRASAEKV